MAQTKRPDAGHIPYMFSINIFKIHPFLCPNFKKMYYGLWGPCALRARHAPPLPNPKYATDRRPGRYEPVPVGGT